MKNEVYVVTPERGKSFCVCVNSGSNSRKWLKSYQEKFSKMKEQYQLNQEH